MTAIAHSVTSTFNGLSAAAKLFLLTCVLFFSGVKVANIENSYTQLTYASATVIAKTQIPGSARSASTGYSILAVRLPNGAVQDVYTSFSKYATTEVGSKWGVFTSPALQGMPLPGYESARRLLVLGLFFGFAFALVATIGTWLSE